MCPRENKSDCCYFRGTLGSFIPVSGKHWQSGGTAVPTSCAGRKTRDLGCQPLGLALHLSISVVRTILRGWICFSGVQGKASVHVGHSGGERIGHGIDFLVQSSKTHPITGSKQPLIEQGFQEGSTGRCVCVSTGVD